MAAVNNLEKSINIDKTRIHIEEPLATSKFAWDLISRLQSHGVEKESPKVLLCIGTDRSTGDCLGPLVGSKMDMIQQDFFRVYGTLDNPVHASNLKEKLDEIHIACKDPFIIAIDACLGNIENVGCINLGNGSLQPGAGVNKDLPSVGQIHITGIVNVGGFMEYLVLQNTRLNLVMRLADTIVGGLGKTIAEFTKLSARGS
jgi:putative sporulation protein YyaC